MSIKDKIPALAVTTVMVGGMAVIISNMASGPNKGIPVDVKVPELTAAAKVGQVSFAENCAACHGENAAGSDQGPPLVHDIYNPGHHADQAFVLAAKRGVRQHHWQFGNMPSQPNITTAQLKPILSYVRELQRANGIFFKSHDM